MILEKRCSSGLGLLRSQPEPAGSSLSASHYSGRGSAEQDIFHFFVLISEQGA
jgi:hypothetical protein